MPEEKTTDIVEPIQETDNNDSVGELTENDSGESIDENSINNNEDNNEENNDGGIEEINTSDDIIFTETDTEVPEVQSIGTAVIAGDTAEVLTAEKAESQATSQARTVGCIFLLTCALLLGFGTFSFISKIASHDVGLMLAVDGRNVGFVNSVITVDYVRDSLENHISSALGRSYTLDADISYSFRLTDGSDEALMYNELYTLLGASCEDMVCDAYSLYIDGVYVASASSRETIEKAIAKISDYCSEYELSRNAAAESIDITSNFEIVEERLANNSLRTSAQIVSMFRAPQNPGMIRTDTAVLTSTSASALSSASDSITEEVTDGIRIELAVEPNTDVDYGFSRVSDESHAVMRTNNINPFSLIDYDIVSYETYTEIVPFTVENQTSPYYYDGFTFKSQDGSDGIIENINRVVTRNGEVISSTLYATNIISEMKPEVYTTGTKEPPPAKATGVFLWPLQNDFMISSPYGINRGAVDGDAFHFGIDLTGEVGDFVFAADGGEVIYSGRRSSYGIVVMIKHSDKLQTYYAHLNEAMVEVGEMVYPGQLIGTVGMTGVTTGPHLHFEIRENSYPVDPWDYMPEH